MSAGTDAEIFGKLADKDKSNKLKTMKRKFKEESTMKNRVIPDKSQPPLKKHKPMNKTPPKRPTSAPMMRSMPSGGGLGELGSIKIPKKKKE
jgi:hypothetical protein